jgi:hypothetical protein
MILSKIAHTGIKSVVPAWRNPQSAGESAKVSNVDQLPLARLSDHDG